MSQRRKGNTDFILDIQGAAAKLHPLQGADHIIKNALNNRIIE